MYTICIPKYRLNIILYAMYYANIKIWNKLNKNLKIIENIKLFIKMLTIYYIYNY